ncbi:MAG: ArsR/SmtB family transcription factor [Phycisphaerales bacterium]
MKRSLHILADRLGAASDPVRLRLLCLLESHELSVGEIASVVQLPQSTVSRHLKHLAETGWLQRRSEGPASYFQLVLDDQPREIRELWRVVRGQVGDLETSEDRRRAAAVVAERRTDSQTFFGRIGGDWDALRTELFGGRFTALGLLSLIDPAWTVADFGCGTGNVAEILAPVVSRVYAIDSSPTMLEAARARIASRANVSFVLADSARTGIPAQSVDAAVAVLLLHHVESPEATVTEMRRVLRENGVALILDMMPHDRDEYRRLMGHRMQGIGRDAVLELLTGAGLSRCEYRPLPHEPGSKGPELFVAVGRR